MIRLTNVAVHVSHNMDGVPMSYPACGVSNCNIVFGSNNTATVVENTYLAAPETGHHILHLHAPYCLLRYVLFC